MSEIEQLPPLHLDYIGTEARPYLYRLLEPITIQRMDGSWQVIPAGYETNFASIPELIQGFIPTQSPSISRAAILHDWDYDNRKTPLDWAEKKKADREFKYQLFKHAPDKDTRNKMMYVAVKLFGRKQFRKL